MSLWPKAAIKVFGSRLNGLVLPTSDWDLVIFGATSTKDGTALRALGRVSLHSRCVMIAVTVLCAHVPQAIEAADISSYMEVIEKARVPIVKMRDSGTGLNVDICFDVDSGVKSSELVLKCVSQSL